MILPPRGNIPHQSLKARIACRKSGIHAVRLGSRSENPGFHAVRLGLRTENPARTPNDPECFPESPAPDKLAVRRLRKKAVGGTGSGVQRHSAGEQNSPPLSRLRCALPAAPTACSSFLPQTQTSRPAGCFRQGCCNKRGNKPSEGLLN